MAGLAVKNRKIVPLFLSSILRLSQIMLKRVVGQEGPWFQASCRARAWFHSPIIVLRRLSEAQSAWREARCVLYLPVAP